MIVELILYLPSTNFGGESKIKVARWPLLNAEPGDMVVEKPVIVNVIAHEGISWAMTFQPELYTLFRFFNRSWSC